MEAVAEAVNPAIGDKIMTKYFVAGGAGFIGSHLSTNLLADTTSTVVIFDNFSSGREWHIAAIRNDPRLTVVRGEISDGELLSRSMTGCDTVFHFASNPDIAKAVTQPDVDFWEGTYLTQQIVEAMRKTTPRTLIYASGSGIYGDVGRLEVKENHAPLVPISTYGASKLAGEALIASYCHMFDFKAAVFRFANVIGPHQTHGVVYDFVRRLRKDPSRLAILGDGTQSKSYIHVSDVVSAMRLIEMKHISRFDAFNVATLDYLMVKDIVDMTLKAMCLEKTERCFGTQSRGWKGDIPIVRFDTAKIRALGWKNVYTCREAMAKTIDDIIADEDAGRFDIR